MPDRKPTNQTEQMSTAEVGRLERMDPNVNYVVVDGRLVETAVPAPRRAGPRMVQIERIGKPAAKVLATFALVNGRVVAVWHDHDYQTLIENGGIKGGTGRVRLEDGAPFFDALTSAYSGSPTLRAVVVTGKTRA